QYRGNAAMTPITNINHVTKFRSIFPDLAMLFVIILAGLVYTFRIEQFMDIALYDESVYLHSGISVPNGFPSAEYAPLYALWYYFLSFLDHDTIKLYYLNYKVMTVLPAVLIFVVLRVNSVSRTVSFFCSCGFLLSAANFATVPKVSHFAILIILSGLIVSSLQRDRCLQIMAITIFSFLAS
ncbi:MAG: hypothetical protein ACP5U1_15735, partial [Desulfomonilaceae bacterium]